MQWPWSVDLVSCIGSEGFALLCVSVIAGGAEGSPCLLERERGYCVSVKEQIDDGVMMSSDREMETSESEEVMLWSQS